jgi:hypothetical protein
MVLAVVAAPSVSRKLPMVHRWLLALLAAFPSAAGAAPASPAPPSLFTDEAAAAGLDFVHFNGMSGELYFPEMTGQGGALLDYDQDGDLDVYLVQGHMLGPGKEIAQATFAPRHPVPLSDRLYRNDLAVTADGERVLRFTDVTEESGIARLALGYGMGVAVADVDNDGWPDLYLASFGSNQMLRNRSDGTFEDVTAATGTDDTRWSIGASFFDYDEDGWLDLYVVNYVDFSFAVHKDCSTPSGTRDYCGPLAYEPVPDRLFRNRGPGPDGVTFEDVSARAGIAAEVGSGLGVVTADFDGDGRTDVYVANDGRPNFLWLNRGDGTFSDAALLAGTAVNRAGQPEASMGVDAADADGDGDEDLFMAHLTGETNTFYRNQGGGLFVDDTVRTGLGPPSLPSTGFGTGFFDYDNDGWLDLFVANGAVKTIEALARERDPYPLHQKNLLFQGAGGGRYQDVSARAGAVFELSEVSRGAAFGDVDGDGDPDVLVTNNAGPARLLVNRVGQDRSWVGLRLLGRAGWDALGARAAVSLPGQPPLWRRVKTDGSYASAHDPRLLFGLGEAAAPVAIRVVWPDGATVEWTGLPADRYATLSREPGGGVP